VLLKEAVPGLIQKELNMLLDTSLKKELEFPIKVQLFTVLLKEAVPGLIQKELNMLLDTSLKKELEFPIKV
ncbi:hypothetical protein BOQ60_26655, partial [Chryseobacterium sp. CH1]